MRLAPTILSLLLAAAPSGRTAAAPATRLDAAPLSIDQAVERVQHRYGARAVRAEELKEAGERVYRIRLLAPDGRVSTVFVNARTGEVR